jgi:hypothetical protein
MALKLGLPYGEPVLARNVAANTAATLHLDTAGGGVAPTGVNHLPCGVMIDGADSTVTDALEWTDASGTNVTSTLAPGVYTPMAPAALRTGGPAVTVFWRK